MCKRRFDPDAAIATLLIRAQNASNGGKGKAAISANEKALADNAAGYVVKDSCIKEAIKLVQEHQTVFNVYITKDRRNKARHIVSFATKLDGHDLWVTFHCPFDYVQKNRGKMPKHEHLIPSEDAAKCLYRHFCPFGKYC